jgi:hypothetical protein
MDIKPTSKSNEEIEKKIKEQTAKIISDNSEIITIQFIGYQGWQLISEKPVLIIDSTPCDVDFEARHDSAVKKIFNKEGKRLDKLYVYSRMEGWIKFKYV